jgi:hypothetical protein
MGATGTALAKDKGKFGVAPNSAPRTDVERRALEAYCQLQAAESDLKSVGVAFGHAVSALRKETGHGGWMPRLRELRISYEKARYWMAKAQHKPTDRHKDPDGETKKADRRFSWDSATDELDRLKNKIYSELKGGKPQDVEGFARQLMRLAKELRRDKRKWGKK